MHKKFDLHYLKIGQFSKQRNYFADNYSLGIPNWKLFFAKSKTNQFKIHTISGSYLPRFTKIIAKLPKDS